VQCSAPRIASFVISLKTVAATARDNGSSLVRRRHRRVNVAPVLEEHLKGSAIPGVERRLAAFYGGQGGAAASNFVRQLMCIR
jgi:hypothetical protein